MGEPQQPPRKFLALGALLVVAAAGVALLTMTEAWQALADRVTGAAAAKAPGKAKTPRTIPAVLIRVGNTNLGIRLSKEAADALQVEPVEARAAVKPRPLPPQVG